MVKKPVVLCILDGYGVNENHEHNAIYEAKAPVMDKLMKEYPWVKGGASGLDVGLPDGQMGNSEIFLFRIRTSSTATTAESISSHRDMQERGSQPSLTHSRILTSLHLPCST